MRKAISVTLDEVNVLWLRGQAVATAKGSLSDVLDRIVSEARTAGRASSAVRSVRNTIDLPDDDPNLEQADAYVRALFEASVRRPVLVKEAAARYGAARKKAKRRG